MNKVKKIIFLSLYSIFCVLLVVVIVAINLSTKKGDFNLKSTITNENRKSTVYSDLESYDFYDYFNLKGVCNIPEKVVSIDKNAKVLLSIGDYAKKGERNIYSLDNQNYVADFHCRLLRREEKADSIDLIFSDYSSLSVEVQCPVGYYYLYQKYNDGDMYYKQGSVLSKMKISNAKIVNSQYVLTLTTDSFYTELLNGSQIDLVAYYNHQDTNGCYVAEKNAFFNNSSGTKSIEIINKTTGEKQDAEVVEFLEDDYVIAFTFVNSVDVKSWGYVYSHSDDPLYNDIFSFINAMRDKRNYG